MDYSPPNNYERFLIEEAKEYLKNVESAEYQYAFDVLCRWVANKFPPSAKLGMDGARELVAALFVKGVI